MADRQFTYKVDIDTASAKAAANEVRAMFADVAQQAERQIAAASRSASRSVSRSGAGGQEGIRGGGGGRTGGSGGGLVEIERFRAAREKERQADLAGIKKLNIETARLEQERDDIIMRAARTRMAIRKRETDEAIKEENRRVRQAKQADVEMQRMGRLQSQAQEMNRRFDAGQLDGQGRPIAQKQGGGGNRLEGALKFGFLAYGATLAVQQATQATVEFGLVGAQQLRTQQTIEQLGDRIGVDSDKMAQAVKKATNSSISDMQAMGFSANILAQRFAGEIDDISGDTALLAKASRRLAQIYTDENGELLSTEQVFSRLVKFAREGNKELVDQFGISNQLIAETLGIPDDGLRGAEGAVNRWKGMVQIMKEEMIRLGEPVDSTADRMEQAFARMTTAVDKLRQASAEPITIAVEFAADALTDIANLGEWIDRPKRARAVIEQQQGSTDPVIQAHVEQLRFLQDEYRSTRIGLIEFERGLKTTLSTYEKYVQQMEREAAELLKLKAAYEGIVENFTSTTLAEGVASRRMGSVLAGQIAPADLTEAEREYRMQVGDSAERLAILQAAVDAATAGTDEWIAAMFALTGAQLDLAGDIDAVKGRFLDLQSDIADFQLDMRMGAAANDAERISILRGLGLSDTTAEGRKTELQIADLERSVVQENARLAKAAQQEWMQTAKDVERMFEAAADKIMSIPGVTSLTPVTEQEMLESKYGAYREQPDEFMRQVRDELLNKVDRPNVSLEQVAGLTGLSGGLPPELLIGRLEEKWQSGALFADPANLGLMNMDAIRGRFDEMKAGETGRANQKNFIMEQLGISAQDAALITGQQAPIVQMLTGGQSDEEISSQLGGTLKNVMGLATGEIEFAKPMLSQWTAQFSTDETVKGLKTLGKQAALGFFAGFSESIAESGFAQAIIGAIKGDIAESLAEMAAAS